MIAPNIKHYFVLSLSIVKKSELVSGPLSLTSLK